MKKNITNYIKNRLDTTGKNISRLGHLTIETIKNEEYRKSNNEKNKHNLS